jgi:lipid-binding SYLF domain-containing protein
MRTRKSFAVFLLITAGLIVLPALVYAGVQEEAKVQAATSVFKEFMGIPEGGIPPSLLDSAHGLAIFPDMLNAGFFFGGRYGVGVMIVRAEDNTWSNPVFFRVIGGSFGFQFGAQSTDVILVFKSIRSLDAITSGKFTLGLDASIAAGPVGRHAAAGTDIQLRAEILSYSRSRGLFFGASLEGAALQVQYGWNSAFYNTPGLLPMEIFRNRAIQAPPVANELKSVITSYANAP